jgi:hypothetical protein
MHLHSDEISSYARRGTSEPVRSKVEAHLAECATCRSSLAEAVQSRGAAAPSHHEVTDQRSGHRIPTDDPAILQIVNPLSSDHWEVQIRNVSKDGMSIRTATPIDGGALVKVQRGTMIAFGEVRYCVAVGDMFHCGILLQELL